MADKDEFVSPPKNLGKQQTGPAKAGMSTNTKWMIAGGLGLVVVGYLYIRSKNAAAAASAAATPPVILSNPDSGQLSEIQNGISALIDGQTAAGNGPGGSSTSGGGGTTTTTGTGGNTGTTGTGTTGFPFIGSGQYGYSTGAKPDQSGAGTWASLEPGVPVYSSSSPFPPGYITSLVDALF